MALEMALCGESQRLAGSLKMLPKSLNCRQGPERYIRRIKFLPIEERRVWALRRTLNNFVARRNDLAAGAKPRPQFGDWSTMRTTCFLLHPCASSLSHRNLLYRKETSAREEKRSTPRARRGLSSRCGWYYRLRLRWRATSKAATETATPAFSELILPNCGIDTIAAQRFLVSVARPFSSPPTINATGTDPRSRS